MPRGVSHRVHPGFMPGVGLVPERAIGSGHVAQVIGRAVAYVAEVVFHIIARILAPALVDNRDVLRRQRVVAGHERVVVQVIGALETVVVSAAGIGDKDIRVKRNAMHAGAVAAGAQHAGHLGAVTVIDGRVVLTGNTEVLTLLKLAVRRVMKVTRVGGVVLAGGGHCLHTVLALGILALELEVFSEDARVEHADVHTLAGHAQGIGVIRVGAIQAGVDLGFGGFPGLRVGAPVTGGARPGLAGIQLRVEVAAHARLYVGVGLGRRQVGDNGLGEVENIGGIAPAVAEQPAAVVIQARGVVQRPLGIAEHGTDGEVFRLQFIVLLEGRIELAGLCGKILGRKVDDIGVGEPQVFIHIGVGAKRGNGFSEGRLQHWRRVGVGVIGPGHGALAQPQDQAECDRCKGYRFGACSALAFLRQSEAITCCVHFPFPLNMCFVNERCIGLFVIGRITRKTNAGS
ncbi:hypothetical protein ALP97_05251 [Pseudomonas salomonii]|uniref:Uncharacterized protein n=1 Tax=Pseudomonas salomonii TaxID=191391 RepID=A0A3M4Q7Y4_9PSED|nr:hypothetical protein ALP97_05251 [Pseudomonas salomonii]